jgi:hypothetical protein
LMLVTELGLRIAQKSLLILILKYFFVILCRIFILSASLDICKNFFMLFDLSGAPLRYVLFNLEPLNFKTSL